MRFNCGPTLMERFDAWFERRREWRPWFAWRPVRVGEVDSDGNFTGDTTQCVWLERIERRRYGCIRYRLPTSGPEKL